MQTMKSAILRHARIKISTETLVIKKNGHVLEKLLVSRLCTSTASNSDQVMDRVIELVKQFDRIDASKVTRTADFQKDLSLDSLDKVELVMAFEQEFSIEIPEEKADKFTCCDDVATFIVSVVEEKNIFSSWRLIRTDGISVLQLSSFVGDTVKVDYYTVQLASVPDVMSDS